MKTYQVERLSGQIEQVKCNAIRCYENCIAFVIETVVVDDRENVTATVSYQVVAIYSIMMIAKVHLLSEAS